MTIYQFIFNTANFIVADLDIEVINRIGVIVLEEVIKYEGECLFIQAIPAIKILVVCEISFIKSGDIENMIVVEDIVNSWDTFNDICSIITSII